jgi:hypothetical protein
MMIPSDLFHDLVDAGVAFKVIQKNLNGPDFVFSVPRASKNVLKLSMPGDTYRATAGGILVRLNALLTQQPTRDPQSLSLRYAPALDPGAGFEGTIVPEEAKGRQKGFPETIKVSSQILVGDYPNATIQTALVLVEVSKKARLYVMELVDKDVFREISRLSPLALPRELHARLAAAGYYEDSFIDAYGEEAYSAAQDDEDRIYKEWSACLFRLRFGEEKA